MAVLRQPPSIDSFGAGGFRLSGVWRPGSLLLLDDQPAGWRPASMSDLTLSDFAAILGAGPAVSEFVLLGTGPVQAQAPREIRAALLEAGIGLEFMATAAAARLYNVLASEGRRFAVALIAV